MSTTYSYVRVSTLDQNPDRQLDAMIAIGIPPECIFIDKQSGKNMARPQLQRLLKNVKAGDKVIVESVSRFARNTKDLLELVENLSSRGVEFVSQKEHIDTTTPTGKFMLTVFGAVAELERSHILMRQAEGIAAAQRRGIHMGRPQKKLPDNFGELVKSWERKQISLSKVLEQCDNICEATFYRKLSEYRVTHKRQQ